MNLQQRINLLTDIGQYILSKNPLWIEAKENASYHNGWFTPEFTDLAVKNIASKFLQADKLEKWIAHYHLDDNVKSQKIGVVMAGNIPLVGFHDFLCCFICGHKQVIKLSTKDEVLLKHLVEKMTEINEEIAELIKIAPQLKGCDAYIATGSDNSARYFEYYFSKYPAIIRKNRTSVAILDGSETPRDLENLADDIHQYFGLGCRNVTKIFVPEKYDFVPFLEAMKKYHYFVDHHKYRNNYDYHLTIYIMNNLYYMTNDSIVLLENKNVFSPIGTLHYEFYADKEHLHNTLAGNQHIQAIVGKEFNSFGQSQQPDLMDYADGIDTIQFLLSI
ncbi:MAG TPA: acyl-CoA reductase [Chitinophagaceae bacterium]|nr:acyl-CoA reductase [Chitinophagaceae bacterium]